MAREMLGADTTNFLSAGQETQQPKQRSEQKLCKWLRIMAFQPPKHGGHATASMAWEGSTAAQPSHAQTASDWLATSCTQHPKCRQQPLALTLQRLEHVLDRPQGPLLAGWCDWRLLGGSGHEVWEQGLPGLQGAAEMAWAAVG